MASPSSPVRSVKHNPRGPFSPPDPFLFLAYHVDHYPPAANDRMEAPRRGNGADFGNPDYNMYHGDRMPGFPGHPHRGFETLTVTMEGVTDHFDSTGCAGRYGGGDLQWVTAGKGLQHSEMFPLVNRDKPNTMRLAQIWLNLPRKDKMAPPTFLMHWAENMVKVAGDSGASATIVAGRLGATDSGCKAPPHSWGADANNDVAVVTLLLPPASRFLLPPAAIGSAANRVLYVLDGQGVVVGGTALPATAELRLDASKEALVENPGDKPARALMLQGRPIGEPVAQRGPFVMNSGHEIMQAFQDYQRTEFGGWPWDREETKDNHFPASTGRHAVYAMPDGTKRVESPPSQNQAGDAGRTEL